MSRLLPEKLSKWRAKLGGNAGVTDRAGAVPIVAALNAHGAAWLARGAAGAPQWRHLAWSGLGVAPALAQLRAQLPVHKAGITWVLAPSLVRYWLQTPPAQLASFDELRAVAQLRCTQLFGVAGHVGHSNGPSPGAGAGWTVAGNWHASHPFVCSAMPSDWAQALAPVCAAPHQGLDLLALALQQHPLPKEGWLAVVAAQTLFLLRLARSRVISLRFIRLPASASAAQIQATTAQAWSREMLRTEQHANTLQVLWLRPEAKPTVRANAPDGKHLTIPFRPSPSIPTPTVPPCDDGEAAYAAIQEVLLTAWCAEQSLASTVGHRV